MKNFAKKAIRFCLIKFLYPLYNLIYETFHTNYIIVSTSLKPFRYNWGDYVSVILCRLVNPESRYIPHCYTWNLYKKDDVLCIGSIITWMTTPQSTIWGSGIVYSDRELSATPKKVLAVRGPLTREYLQNRGIECPEVYGDPALLFPRYYHPKVEKKYKLGIIPHFRDKSNYILEKFAKDESILIIDVQDVHPWQKFIDNICSCEGIASSSLHGIIISDAYQIPNIWVEFPDGERKGFAFNDYLCSVGREKEKALILNEGICVEAIKEKCLGWKPIEIDLDKLMSVCPFKQK